jgi:signal transduction histidine kinase
MPAALEHPSSTTTNPGMARRGLAMLALAAVLSCALWAVPGRAGPGSAGPGAAGTTKGGLLVVFSSSPAIAWTEAMLATIRQELAERGDNVNAYFEFLDDTQLNGAPGAGEWARFLAAKYRDVRPDVIIADAAPAIRFVTGLKPHVFGAAPVIGILPNFDSLGDTARGVAVRVTTGPHIDQTVDLALSQWPDARKLVIVSDAAPMSFHLAGVIRAALARHPDRMIAVQHLFDFRLEDLETRLAALPGDCVVLYTHVSMDNTGRLFRPEVVAARLVRVSAAPLYVLFETDIDTGAIGGYVNNSHRAGRVAIRAALDILDKDAHPPAPGDNSYSSQLVLDWRQLRRWGLKDDGFPPDAEIRFREPSLFEAHLWEASLGLAFIGVLSGALAAISILFVQRGRLARALRDTNSRLEERVAARTLDIQQAWAGERKARQRLRTFIDMATHEFKTPLSTIDSAAQVLELLVDARRDDVGSRLAGIRRSVRRLVDLVETCLAGERLDQGLAIKFRPCDPAALVRDAVERQRASDDGPIVADIAPLPPRCVADPDLLGIALDALLDNARRYSRDARPIEVSASADDTFLTIQVKDRGPGVPPGEVESIFEKYYRGRGSAGVPGTGIGLHLVRTIATEHGGRIACQPRPDGGASFVLIVPLAASPPAPLAGPPSGAASPSGA